MRKLLIALLLMMFIITPCFAKTPDGKTPHEETICDGQTGAAFGLCNAYCEAMDCDSENPHASQKACDRIKSQYQKHTGIENLPCEEDIKPLGCPCIDYLPEFAACSDKINDFESCIDYYVYDNYYNEVQAHIQLDSESSYILVTNLESPIPICEFYNFYTGYYEYLEITNEELDSCVNTLLEKIDESGLTCEF